MDAGCQGSSRHSNGPLANETEVVEIKNANVSMRPTKSRKKFDCLTSRNPVDSRRGVRLPSNLFGVPAFLDYLCLDGRSTAKEE
ncbi:MAG: hypothetical protein QOH78_2332 [Verrucomicrobiota bacterium]